MQDDGGEEVLGSDLNVLDETMIEYLNCDDVNAYVDEDGEFRFSFVEDEDAGEPEESGDAPPDSLPPQRTRSRTIFLSGVGTFLTIGMIAIPLSAGSAPASASTPLSSPMFQSVTRATGTTCTSTGGLTGTCVRNGVTSEVSVSIGPEEVTYTFSYRNPGAEGRPGCRNQIVLRVFRSTTGLNRFIDEAGLPNPMYPNLVVKDRWAAWGTESGEVKRFQKDTVGVKVDVVGGTDTVLALPRAAAAFMVALFQEDDNVATPPTMAIEQRGNLLQVVAGDIDPGAKVPTSGSPVITDAPATAPAPPATAPVVADPPSVVPTIAIPADPSPPPVDHPVVVEPIEILTVSSPPPQMPVQYPDPPVVTLPEPDPVPPVVDPPVVETLSDPPPPPAVVEPTPPPAEETPVVLPDPDPVTPVTDPAPVEPSPIFDGLVDESAQQAPAE